MSISIGQRLGSYEITALLGEGGMGAVYRAMDTRLNRAVAIKVCASQFSERFAQEASVIASLNHPHFAISMMSVPTTSSWNSSTELRCEVRFH